MRGRTDITLVAFYMNRVLNPVLLGPNKEDVKVVGLDRQAKEKVT
jgi:hypothetical protein